MDIYLFVCLFVYCKFLLRKSVNFVQYLVARDLLYALSYRHDPIYTSCRLLPGSGETQSDNGSLK